MLRVDLRESSATVFKLSLSSLRHFNLDFLKKKKMKNPRNSDFFVIDLKPAVF